MGKVVAVCAADKRGVKKENRERGIFIKDMGIKGDAHAGEMAPAGEPAEL